MPIIEHDNLIPIDNNAILWRYMDLDKFFSLLKNKALFFCRLDKFSDPFEGSIPKREAEYRIVGEKRRSEYLNVKFDEKNAIKNSESLAALHKKLKIATLANCWHINQNESDAMWRLYLKTNEGIAIQTNTLRIKKSLENTNEKLMLSKVRYLNYETGIWYHPEEYPQTGYNLLIPFFHKRIEFKHENEFRLFHEVKEAEDIHNFNEEYWEKQENHIGKFIPVNINNLIEKIILPPTIDIVTEKKIILQTKELGYDFEFKSSALGDKPYY